jgi:hypothetical protein
VALTVGEIQGVIGVDDSGVDAGLANAEGKFRAFARTAATIGAAAGLALGTAVVGAMDVEAGNDKLAAQLGLTAVEAERIGKVAGQLYADAYGGSLEEVNTAVGAVISSVKGMRNAAAADVEALSAKVLDLAKTFEVDVARAAQVAGQMITSGLAKDSTQAMDLLFAGMQRVPAAIREDLLDALDEYGPFMSMIGIKGEQAMALLVKGAEKGMYGIDKTGDALKEFGIRATDMSTTSKAGFDLLGMSQEKMAKKLLAGGDTAKGAFNAIITGLQRIKDPADQSVAALALFGTPLEDLSVSEIPKFLSSLSSAQGGLGKVAGAAERAGKTLNDNATTNLTSFGRQAKKAFVDIVGGQVLPVVTSVAKWLSANFGPALEAVGQVLTGSVIPAVKATARWISENETPIMIVAGLLAAIFIPHLISLGVTALTTKARVVGAWIVMKAQAIGAAAAHSFAIVGMVAKWIWLGGIAVLNGIKVAGAWLLTAGVGAATALATMVATSALFVAKWVWMGVQSLLQAGRVAAAWLIAMGPVGWVIGLVVGLVALVIANWERVKNFTVQLWTAIWNWIKARASDIANWVNAKVRDVVSFFEMLRSLPGKVGAWFGGVKDAATRKLGEMVAFVRGIPGRIVGALGDLGGLLVEKGKDVVRGLWEGIKAMGKWLYDTLIGWAVDLIPGPIARALGIASPSRLMADAIGRHIPTGIVAGIAKTAPLLDKAMTRLVAVPPVPAIPALPASMAGTTRGGDGANASGPGQHGAGVYVERVEVKAFSDRFSLSQVTDDLALHGAS